MFLLSQAAAKGTPGAPTADELPTVAFAVRVLGIGNRRVGVVINASDEKPGLYTVAPRRNAKDLVDVPDEVREKLEIRLADSIEEVLAIALEPKSDVYRQPLP